MDHNALKKAKRRLRVAQDHVNALKSGITYEAFADNWFVFLHAAKGIYTMLEQGAKASPQARQWFAAKNQERKDDPLLRYMSEARNDDEHGIEESTSLQPSILTLGVSAPGSSKAMRDQHGNVFFNVGAAYRIRGGHPDMSDLPQLTPLDGRPVKSEFVPARVILKPVRDRSSRTYDPPKSHLGKDLLTDKPQTLAQITLDYLSGLISEAEGFCKP